MIPLANIQGILPPTFKTNSVSFTPSSIVVRHVLSSSAYYLKAFIYQLKHDHTITLKMDNFSTKSVKDLQKYLKDRGVVFTGYYKACLVELCHSTVLIGLQIDPDGLVEDREELVSSKLIHVLGQSLLTLLDYYFNNISIIPQVNIFDIYNYLVTFRDYDHAIFRDYMKMEGYSMANDGYVLEMKFAHSGVYAVLGKVKPRINRGYEINFSQILSSHL